MGVRTSVYLNARRYFSRTEYLQLTLGAGTAPDEPLDIMTDLERQSATSVRLSLLQSVHVTVGIQGGSRLFV
ncbi:MAG: hypothetical protein MZV63_05255 [Marinilabiliales bacterium]|nr:hypothetical protein [Marinilabiliales bacterium]